MKSLAELEPKAETEVWKAVTFIWLLRSVVQLKKKKEKTKKPEAFCVIHTKGFRVLLRTLLLVTICL